MSSSRIGNLTYQELNFIIANRAQTCVLTQSVQKIAASEVAFPISSYEADLVQGMRQLAPQFAEEHLFLVPGLVGAFSACSNVHHAQDLRDVNVVSFIRPAQNGGSSSGTIPGEHVNDQRSASVQKNSADLGASVIQDQDKIFGASGNHQSADKAGSADDLSSLAAGISVSRQQTPLAQSEEDRRASIVAGKKRAIDSEDVEMTDADQGEKIVTTGTNALRPFNAHSTSPTPPILTQLSVLGRAHREDSNAIASGSGISSRDLADTNGAAAKFVTSSDLVSKGSEVVASTGSSAAPKNESGLWIKLKVPSGTPRLSIHPSSRLSSPSSSEEDLDSDLSTPPIRPNPTWTLLLSPRSPQLPAARV